MADLREGSADFYEATYDRHIVVADAILSRTPDVAWHHNPLTHLFMHNVQAAQAVVLRDIILTPADTPVTSSEELAINAIDLRCATETVASLDEESLEDMLDVIREFSTKYRDGGETKEITIPDKDDYIDLDKFSELLEASYIRILKVFGNSARIRDAHRIYNQAVLLWKRERATKKLPGIAEPEPEALLEMIEDPKKFDEVLRQTYEFPSDFLDTQAGRLPLLDKEHSRVLKAELNTIIISLAWGLDETLNAGPLDGNTVRLICINDARSLTANNMYLYEAEKRARQDHIKQIQETFERLWGRDLLVEILRAYRQEHPIKKTSPAVIQRATEIVAEGLGLIDRRAA